MTFKQVIFHIFRECQTRAAYPNLSTEKNLSKPIKFMQKLYKFIRISTKLMRRPENRRSIVKLKCLMRTIQSVPFVEINILVKNVTKIKTKPWEQ